MTDVYLVALGTEGEIDVLARDTDVVEYMGLMDVVRCPDGRHVGLVGATSALDSEPENHLGWLCYGRSMLHGTVLIKHDDGDPISPALLAMIAEAGQFVRSGLFPEANVVASDFWAGNPPRPDKRPAQGGLPKKEEKAKDLKKEKREKAKKEKEKEKEKEEKEKKK